MNKLVDYPKTVIWEVELSLPFLCTVPMYVHIHTHPITLYTTQSPLTPKMPHQRSGSQTAPLDAVSLHSL